MPRATTPKLLIPLAALLAIVPLLLHGVSCGQDLGFHLQSWLDAAAQLRQGHYPHWAITPAWNAGEPRFVFYPPLSWLFGALLTMVLPAAATPATYIFLTMTAAGFTMHRFARTFATPHAALLAAVLYLANPYMLFNAFERSALAELLAAVWIPLLLLAILRPRPTIHGIALPLALLWLTNAPAAVMGSYTLALLAAIRIGLEYFHRRRGIGHGLAVACFSPSSSTLELAKGKDPRIAKLPLDSTIASLLSPVLLGTALGLALPAFYLIPAATERRFVQVAMAIIPNMRFQDNFLFTHTADTPHNDVNTTASYLTLALLATTVLTLSAVLLTRRTTTKRDAPYRGPQQAPLLAGVAHPASAMWAGDNHILPYILAILTAVITLLLVPLSTPIWLHLPEFAFLQFPWRLNTILSAIAAAALALLLSRLPSTPKAATLIAAIALPIALTFTAYHLYAQGCDVNARPTAMDDFFRTHHGVGPTDEYTPNDADNDLLRTGNPAYWLAPTSHPNAPAPNTVPTPNELNPYANTDDYVPPAAQTISNPAPHRFTVDLPQPAILVLHLRDYPRWDVTSCGEDTTECEHYPQPKRYDGLVAIDLPRGRREIHIAWQTGLDQIIGYAVSLLALLTLFFLPRSDNGISSL